MEKQALETTKDNGLQVAQPQGPDQLIALAIQNNASIDTLERLVALMERNQAKIAEREYFVAYAKFQQIVPALKKTTLVNFTSQRTGSVTNYKFIELDTMCQAIKPALEATGLTYRWKIRDIPATATDKAKIEVTCLVTHVGGHTEETSFSGDADDSGGKNSIQQRGSTVSYLKRYTLDSALGFSSTSDNDGRTAANGKAPAPQAPLEKKDLTVDNEENSKEFGKILVGVISRKGKAKIADIEKHYILTDEQKAKIELANKSAGEPATKPSK